MMVTTGRYILSFLLVLSLNIMAALAQERIEKEIIVVKPYQPTLSDAFKINVMPAVSDSLEIEPRFEYIIHPKKIESEFAVRPIKAANLLGEPLDKLYKTYLSLGLGNYIMPLAELNINSLRSKDKTLGLYLKHHSINGKIKLDKETRIKPGFSENIIDLYGKKIFLHSVLTGDFGVDYYTNNFYGYNPAIDTILYTEDIRQTWLLLDGGFRLHSTYEDLLHLNYDLKLKYNYGQDYYDHFEHGIGFSADLNKVYKGQTFGLETKLDYYQKSVNIDSTGNTVIKLNPWLSKSTEEYSYLIGLNVAADIRGDSVSFLVFPRALLQIKVVDKVLLPYMGVDGYLGNNNYRKIAMENMFIRPGLNVTNTRHKVSGFLGIKGSLTSNLAYNVNFTYSLIDNMYFFVNDSSDILGNKFNVVYDDLEQIRVLLEGTYRYSEKWNFSGKANYYKYSLDHENYAWHMPGMDFILTARYNLKNKILLNGDLFYVGKRYAKDYITDQDPVQLDGYLDLNFGLEYRYTKILSIFLRLNNLLGTENYLWLQYPTMRFNLLAGFTYAL